MVQQPVEDRGGDGGVLLVQRYWLTPRTRPATPLVMRAPYWSALPRGAHVGLNHSHGRGHLVRAALEGVCQQLAPVHDSMRAAGSDAREVGATGGFARSQLLRQLLCDVLGAPIGFAEREQDPRFGAALLGMEALGAIGSIEIAAAMVRITDEISPDPSSTNCFGR